MTSWAKPGISAASLTEDKSRLFDLKMHALQCQRDEPCDECEEYNRLMASIHARDTGQAGRAKEDR